jgi:YD repeat-containing protein
MRARLCCWTRIAARLPRAQGKWQQDTRRLGFDGLETRCLLSASDISATVVVPAPITRYNQAETITVFYRNNGIASMPAPVLVLHAVQNGKEDGLLSLDPANQGVSLNTSATPPGYSQTVEFLASGATPGVLQAGESSAVSVSFGGWLSSQWDRSQPAVSFSLDLITADNSSPINWSALQASLQPSGVSSGAWNALFANVENQFGGVWGTYVSRLDQDASYLWGLGESISDVNTLWSFEIAQANGLGPVRELASATDVQLTVPGSLPATIERSFPASVEGRNLQGPFGYGWSLGGGWERTLSAQPDGTVVISDTDGSQRSFAPEGSSFVALPGDHGTLASLGGGLYTLTEQDGTVSEFGNGRLTYVQDANGNRITAGYDSSNRLSSLTASSGASLSISHNSAGLITKITSSTGQAASYVYDSSNSYLLSVTNFEGYTTSYSYNTATHALSGVTNPDGTQQAFGYDTAGRLGYTAENGSSLEVAYAYGAGGQVTAVDSLGNQTTYFFDEQGLLAKLVNPLGYSTQYQYDAGGDLLKVTNASGQSTSYAYDALGHAVQATDASGATSKFGYGSLNTLTSQTDANGHTTNYSYDTRGNLVSTVYPNGTIESNAIDPLGEITQSTNGDGQVTRYAYDADGRLVSEAFADGTQNTFTYDAVGNLVSATNATGTTHLSFDSANRLTKIVYPDGAMLSYSYDTAGRRTQMIDQSGNVVHYAYNALSELSGLTDASGNPIVSYSYDADGRLSQAIDANGAYSQYAYDAAGHTVSVTNYAPGGAVNSSFAYAYNALGLCTSETTTQGSWSYAYDKAGHMTQATFTSNNSGQLANQSLQYFYDANGNRTETIINGVTTYYTTNNRNEYTQVGSTAYAYDGNGSLISATNSSGVTSFSYNAAAQLVGIQGANGISTSFAYDPLGNLYSSVQNGQRAQFVVDPTGLGNIVSQYNSTGGLVASFTYGLGLVRTTTASQVSSFYQFDALGSTADLTNAAGSVINSYSYVPFGGILSTSGGALNSFQFVGQSGVNTVAPGLDLTRARLYDVSLGRFDSQDPLGRAGSGTNLFEYAKNCPVTLLDPSGLWTWKGVVQTAFPYVKGTLQILGGAVGVVGGGLAVLETGGLFTPGALVAAEGAASIGAGVTTIWRTAHGEDTSLVAGGVFEFAGEVADAALNNQSDWTLRKAGTIADLAVSWPNLIETPFTYLGKTLSITEAGKKLSDISAGVGAGVTAIENFDKAFEWHLTEPEAPETPGSATPGASEGAQDMAYSFGSDDAVASVDTSKYSPSGAYEGQTQTYLTDNANGTVASSTEDDFSSSNSYTGQVDTSIGYDSSGNPESATSSDVNASGVTTSETLNDYFYQNGTPSEDYVVHESVSGSSDVVQDAEVFNLNDSGDVSSMSDYYYNEGAPTGSSQATYTYNSDDQVSDVATNYYDTTGTELSTDNNTFNYDSSGMPTDSTDVGESPSGTREYQDTYQYDSSGSISSADDSYYNSNGTESADYNYDYSAGSPSLTQLEDWSYNGGSTPSSSVTDVYQDGSLASAETMTYSGGEPSSSYTYDYNNGLPTLDSTEYWSYANPSEPVSNTYDYSNGVISTQQVTDYNSSNDPISDMTSEYYGGSPVSDEFWYYDSAGNVSATDTYDQYNFAGQPTGSVWDNYDSSGDMTSYSDTNYTFGSDGSYTGADTYNYDSGAYTGTTTSSFSYNPSGQFSGSTNDIYDTSGGLQDSYDLGLTYSGGELSQLVDNWYNSQNDLQYATTDQFSNGDLSSLDYETYNSYGSPLSNDYYDNGNDGLSLANSEYWNYGSSNDLQNYYTDSYSYDNSGLYSSNEIDYGSGGSELGYYDANYDGYGNVTSDTQGFYGNSGAYLGDASTSYDYGGSSDSYVSGYDTSYYGASNSLDGSVGDTYSYDNSGGLDSASFNYSGYSDPSYNGSGSLDYSDNYLSSYSFDGSGYSDTSYFDSGGDPYYSSDYSQATDYGGDYYSYDNSNFVASSAAMLPVGTTGMASIAHAATMLRAPATATTGTTSYFRRVGLQQSGTASATGPDSSSALGVSESPTYVVGNGDTFHVSQGTTFIANLGLFTDSAPSTSDYTANINWGDGTVSPGVVSATAGGKFAVIGTHQYARTGSYTISVPVTDNTGAKVSNSCTALVIPSLSQSAVSGTAGSFQAGGSTQVTLTVNDSTGKHEAVSGLSVVFGLTEGSAGGSFGSVTDHGDGTYTATFTSTSAGSNTITASIDGQELTNPGYTLTVTPGPVSLAQSTLSVASPSASAGSTDTVTFIARDAYGNQETSGGLNVSFVQGLSPGSGSFSNVQYVGTGTYTATFTATTSGTAAINVVVGGNQSLLVVPTIMVTGGAAPASATSLIDPGFEAPSQGGAAFQYHPSGSAWTFARGAGVSGNGSGFTAGNLTAPEGAQVAFLQGYGSVSQSVTLAAGSYYVTFDAAQRGNAGQAGQAIAVQVDGNQVAVVNPNGTSYALCSTGNFTVGLGTHTITLAGLNPHGGDNTALIDNVTIQAVSGGPLLDPGFEAPGLRGSAFQYGPTGSPWSFSGDAGVAANGSGFTSGNPAAPQGAQVAFLQGTGSLSQSVSLAAGTYILTIDAAQRGNFGPQGQAVEVLLDGAPIESITPGGAIYLAYNVPITVAAGSHTITLAGLNPHGGDNTALVDQVLLESRSGAQPQDAGFESPSQGGPSFLYDPTGSPWTFRGLAGVAGNGSGFTYGNPPALEGVQVAFIQGTGSVSQTLSLPAGSYVVELLAAQRGNMPQAGQTIAVLIDGGQVGAITPGGAYYAMYQSGRFTVAAGTHTVTIAGLNPNGGDNTAFVDGVRLFDSPATAAATVPLDPGFEPTGDATSASGFQYGPTGLPWAFAGLAGVAANGSGFTSGNPNAPQGGQVAFLQGSGSITQTISMAAGAYQISLYAAQRGNMPQAGQSLAVLVDGAQVDTITPLGTNYQRYTPKWFTVSDGAHIITLAGLNPHGGDNTALVDQVLIQATSAGQPFDPGFEAPSQAFTGYQYDPSASPWTFSGTAGVAGNGSSIAGGFASAPEGGQAAFLQGSGSISQTVDLSGGNYVLSFYAAQAAGNAPPAEAIGVLVDGVQIATITPNGKSYGLYSTASFTASAGAHTLSFTGQGSGGGSNTVLIDEVLINHY